MVATPLVDQDIADGRTLLEQLDRDRIPVSAAFWYYRSESDRWSLVIATPHVSSKGPLEAYRTLSQSMRRILTKPDHHFDLESSRVELVKEEDELPSLLRRAVTTGHTIAGIRFARSTINGRPIEDAYIYRMERPLAARTG